eukprot:TRINITY_DN19640_c0_g1_i1.p1 TRINITY_DN19640_c0_g1~~TRINITY_DN19640_c0_g1_i1.p1  ORF type:complete len:552 (+),score=163.69 TRINITY_DN19640_c0_g1_i1:58-1713(+)
MADKLDRLSQPKTKRVASKPEKKEAKKESAQKPAKAPLPKKEAPKKAPVAATSTNAKKDAPPKAAPKEKPAKAPAGQRVPPARTENRADAEAAVEHVADAPAAPAGVDYVFFSLVTAASSDVVEFAAVVIDSVGLFETEVFSTLLKPPHVAIGSDADSGVTASMLRSAPTFADAAGRIFDVLNGRVWAGYDVGRRYGKQLLEQFELLGRQPPVPAGVFDTLAFLGTRFGKRAGNLKLSTLCAHFGLCTGTRRALEDARLNVEILKRAALALLLEHPHAETAHGEAVAVAVESHDEDAAGVESESDEDELEAESPTPSNEANGCSDQLAEVAPSSEPAVSPREQATEHSSPSKVDLSPRAGDLDAEPEPTAASAGGRRSSDAGVRSRSGSGTELPRSRSSSKTVPVDAGNEQAPSEQQQPAEVDLSESPFGHKLHNPDEPVRSASAYPDVSAVDNENPFGHRLHNPDEPIRPVVVASAESAPADLSTEKPAEVSSPARRSVATAESPGSRRSIDEVHQSVESKIAEKIRRIREQQALPGVPASTKKNDAEEF